MEARSDLESLLDHAAWARWLARSLTRDEHAADDLVQRAWLAALEHRPDGATPVRRWLAAVMRNFVRQDVRDAERRSRRERTVARNEADDSHNALAESLALQRRLLDLVERLDEPDRRVIWSRYYEGLPPREIAQRDGVPVQRVKKQLHHALEKLRQRLDREHGGDRSAWLSAFAPLLHAPGPKAVALGVLLVNAKLKVLALLAVVIAFAVWMRVSSSAPLDAHGAQREVSPSAVFLTDEPATTPIDLDQRTSVATRTSIEGETPRAKSSAEDAAPRTIHGRVFDLEQRGVGGIEVVGRTGAKDRALDAPRLATTAVDGSFEVAASEIGRELAARGGNWVTVFASYAWNKAAASEATIFVAQRRALAGTVVDPARNPISGAQVTWIAATSLRRDLGTVLDHAMLSEWTARTDANGRFELEDAPLAPGQLRVEAVGWRVSMIEPPQSPTWDLSIVLEPLETPHIVVKGRVVDRSGEPVDGAHVGIGPQSMLTHEDGAFAFDLSDVTVSSEAAKNADGVWVPKYTNDAIVAVKPGRLPARYELPPPDELRQLAEREVITLVLDGEPLTIRGRVVDADGKAVEGAVVRADDETPFGMIYAVQGSESYGIESSVERLLRGGFSAREPRSGSDGAFVLDGLLDREYRVAVLDRKTLRRATSEPIRAGARDVIITLASERECVRVAGIVAANDGSPIAGANVVLGVVSDKNSPPTFGASVEADEHGHFEFAKVQVDGLALQISHPSIVLMLDWRPTAQDRLDDLVIHAMLRCHVQVDLGDRKDYATSFAALDAKGEPVRMYLVHGAISWLPEKVDIIDGKSEAAAVEDTGVTIVLYKGDVEVERVPVKLKPGELVTVRP